MLSSLQLQRLLHFSAFYAFVFGLAHIGLTIYKLAYLVANEKVWYSLPVAVTAWCICEPPRLILGYVGNLRERVPELSAFWLLTLVPQLPVVIYLTCFQWAAGSWLPIDLALGILPIMMNLLQAWHGYTAIKKLIAKQTADFSRLCREDELNALAAREAAAGGPSATFAGAAAYGDEVAWSAGPTAGTAGGGGYQRIPGSGPLSGSSAYGSAFSAGAGEADGIGAGAGAGEPTVGSVAAMGARHLVSLATGGGGGGSSSGSGVPSAAGQGRPPLSSVGGRARPQAAAASAAAGSGGGVELPPITRNDRDKVA